MKFKLEIDCDNAAFEDEPPSCHEIARILREAAWRISEYGLNTKSTSLSDVNGNKVGKWEIE